MRKIVRKYHTNRILPWAFDCCIVELVAFYFIGNSFSYKAKMLRRDATRVEMKMHLRAHTGAQRVTK